MQRRASRLEQRAVRPQSVPPYLSVQAVSDGNIAFDFLEALRLPSSFDEEVMGGPKDCLPYAVPIVRLLCPRRHTTVASAVAVW